MAYNCRLVLSVWGLDLIRTIPIQDQHYADQLKAAWRRYFGSIATIKEIPV